MAAEELEQILAACLAELGRRAREVERRSIDWVCFKKSEDYPCCSPTQDALYDEIYLLREELRARQGGVE